MSLSRNMFIGAAVAAAVLLPATAFADAHSEIVNAGMHAGFAAGAPDVAGAHAHLHHALNCIVGPSGDGFDAKEMNPCANAGKGAIADTISTSKKASLEAAAAKAREGIAAADLATAQKDASDLRVMLNKQE
ncbi:MAG TPA: hypothetical protein VHZ29_11150 [Rhizomicrobium sp.]|jgi:hypothetical protein|nr:hypothetical protein [Rhizomicrobium sp.]